MVLGVSMILVVFSDRTLGGWAVSLYLELIAPRSCFLFRFSLLSPGFRPPRKAGAANVAALASGLFIGVSSPKGIWGGVDVAALASG